MRPTVQCCPNPITGTTSLPTLSEQRTNRFSGLSAPGAICSKISRCAELGGTNALLYTSTADNIWSDLPLQPVFLPLAHQLVEYTGHWLDRPAAVLVGEVEGKEETRGPEEVGGEFWRLEGGVKELGGGGD